jgi:predicted TIM-barrel fold metal-dependent hydrolase
VEFLGTKDKSQSPRMEVTPVGKILYAHNKHASRIVNPGHFDPDARIKDMDRCGIDTQVITLTIPGVEELPLEEGVTWAGKINDYFAQVCRAYPGRFYACASLPLQDMNETVKELERAHTKLGARGITLYSNINFKPLSSPEFFPLYQKAEEYDMPIFIHPAIPFTDDIMKEHGLMKALYGFTFDTTMAVMSLIWKGVLAKFPGVKLIHAHLGGVAPYLVQRMEDCWAVVVRDKINYKTDALAKTPSDYYREQVYPDSMSAYLPAMRCCLEFVGSTHICLGTDYAHTIGNWDHAVEFIRKLGLSEEDTNLILGGNAVRIFHLD